MSKQQKPEQTISEKTKSKKTIYKAIVIGTLAFTAAFLIFAHDAIARGVKGYFGFSSMRVMVWTISILVFGIAGWFNAFYNAKGKLYKFTYLVPILIATYQLLIYVFDARKTDFNQLNTKTMITFTAIGAVIGYYFYKKLRK